jgi:hypothetical protein
VSEDFDKRGHLEWLGYTQPVGVVVSATALVEAGVALPTSLIELSQQFDKTCPRDSFTRTAGNNRAVHFRDIAIQFLGWRDSDLQLPPESMTTFVSGYDDVMYPTYVVPDLMLVQELSEEKTPTELDAEIRNEASNRWKASPQMRFERLLREANVPIGLLVCTGAIRLVYAPKGESSGHITFVVDDMRQVAGRPILGALFMLLGQERLFVGPEEQRLPALLKKSRTHQNAVSTKLATQVMEALFELLHGYQQFLRNEPNVYEGLLTVLLRLVFVLYAEDRDLLSSDPLYVNHYSVNGLYESLREDEGRHPETIDSRYGAWARLLVLFRLIYKGARHGNFRLPARKGYLFDPERFPFLEKYPRISDGTIYRVLRKLMVLDGERLSYRSLDVEQIGSVYEASMGFALQVAEGASIAIKAKKKTGAPVTVNLEELLRQTPAKRNEWFSKQTDQKLTGAAERDLKAAVTVDELMAALDRRIAKNVTADRVPKGALIFQPSAERRRSGSHYTPRSLTSPIVKATLEPVLAQLGTNRTPEQILALKVCDPAMGSGAFLVEACRQLGDALVEAWHTHKATPALPPDEEELLHARRLVAQRCLYGVDKNEMAVDLAKLSLWLATLARDHEFTFLNHSLRHGDSLLGLSARQIAAFHWDAPSGQSRSFFEGILREKIVKAANFRREILDAREDVNYEALSFSLARADDQLEYPRIYGDLVLSAFFAGNNRARRKDELQRLAALRDNGEEGEFKRITEKMRSGEKPLVPFHWEIEFPEVFQLDTNSYVQGGFDVVVGNPPFAGKNTLIEGHANGYLDWLKTLHEESHGNSDLVAHFFRRGFHLLRQDGCFGLIATNTIGQGDTRSTGLRWICTHGGTIYRARKRRPWPGEAAVIVSVVNIGKGAVPGPYWLDGRAVEKITAYLFHAGGHEDPERLRSNENLSFEGYKIYGPGFTFDDTDQNGVASPICEVQRLIENDPRNADRIFPYLGGEEVNTSPTHAYHRYVIDFEDFPLSWQEAPTGHKGPVAADWPNLLKIVEERVKPQRRTDNRENYRRLWWQYAERRPGLRSAIRNKKCVLVLSLVSEHVCIARVSAQFALSNRLAVFALDSPSDFAGLQSRVHELWARFFGSTLEGRFMYAIKDCFETFAFPHSDDRNVCLEEVGRTYYDVRADLMIRNNEGLTKTYNRFHNPNERSADIKKLRKLHDQMDRAVLDAYGWSDIRPVCEFFPEFEDDEEEENESRRPRTKKYRYRWPDEIHDEVLARLLALNQERAAQGR